MERYDESVRIVPVGPVAEVAGFTAATATAAATAFALLFTFADP